MKISSLVTAFLVAGMIPVVAQSNPGSTNATDVEMELAWPDGTIYVSSEHDNDKTFEFPDAQTTITGTTNIVNWQEQSGGNGFISVHSTNPYRSSYDYDDSWVGGRWPEFGSGVQTSLSDGSTNFIYAPEGTSLNTSFGFGYLNFSCSPYIPWLDIYGSISLQYNDQSGVSLVTGGDPTSSGDELYSITGTAETIDFTPEDPYDPTYSTIRPEQIQIGNLGSLTTAGTNNGIPYGTLWAALPMHTEVSVTPSVSGSKYQLVNIGAQPYPLISQCVATTPSNRARTTIGVGEQVNLSFPSLFIPYSNIVWSATAGSLLYTNGNSTQLIAPSNAANVTVTATVFGKSVSMAFKVVEPSGIDHAVIAATNNISGAPSFTTGQAGAEMLLNVYFTPTNVSFYRVSIMEVGEDGSSISGYFGQWTPQQLHHSTADHWTTLNQANEMNDICSGGPYPSPWSSGSFTWDIPGRWQVIGSGATNSLNGWNQVFLIDSSGTAKITKNNHWVQRTTANIITTQ